MEKKCSCCQIIKETNLFHYKKSENRYHSWCKECLYRLQKERWKDRKRKAIELFGGKCFKCNYNKNLAALHFHHKDPSQKEFVWEKLKLRSWDKIIDELKKCILICANCHAELHNPKEEMENLKSAGKDNVSFNGHSIYSSGKCPVCDKEVYGTKHCSTICAGKASRRVKNRPTKEELFEKLKTMTMVAIAKEYNVSDNAVRKWLK